MLARLKKLLSECHLTGDIVNVLAQADFDYLVQRAKEELDYVKQSNDMEDSKRRLVLATRLITLARYKQETPIEPVQSKTTRRRRAGSKDTGSNNNKAEKT